MTDFESQLETALNKNTELMEKNEVLKRTNLALSRDLEIARMEILKNKSLINELNTWVQNLTEIKEINSGNHEALHKINQVKNKQALKKNLFLGAR